jgi:PhoPQ-activated pathogenicity-related protein
VGLLSVVMALAGQEAPAALAHPGIAAYVARPDATFAWKLLQNDTTPAGKVLRVELASQTWEGITWQHDLRIYEPKELKYPNTALLFITGGSIGRKAKLEDDLMGFSLAELCGGRVAFLPQVPNQPLYDGKVEDDLISHTFLNYLATGEADWPLLQPMVKSATAAMTAVQEVVKERGGQIDGFVVTGASKRGWTTWLTGAHDPRVIAIAPMVIPTLNMKAQTIYQMASWGKYSEQIDDYVSKGLLKEFDTPRGSVLWKLVDPYTYLDQVKVPVLQINGTNDRYWTVDSVSLYWKDIKTPRTLCQLPNAGHGLDENRGWALSTLAAFFRANSSGAAWPAFEGEVTAPGDRLQIAIGEQAITPKAWNVWAASSASRDFRESRWSTEYESQEGPHTRAFTCKAELARPATGYRAAFVELVYEIEGREAHLSTPIVVFDKDGVVGPQSPPVPRADAATGGQ